MAVDKAPGNWNDYGGLYGCMNDVNGCLLFTCEPCTLGLR